MYSWAKYRKVSCQRHVVPKSKTTCPNEENSNNNDDDKLYNCFKQRTLNGEDIIQNIHGDDC